MKRLNLNLELNEKLRTEIEKGEEKDIVKIAANWIKSAIQNACNKPQMGQRGMQPTQMPTMDDQENFVKISNCISSAKEGIAVIEDDVFKWMKEKFEEARLPMQEGISEILVEIRDNIKKADISK